MTIFSFLPIVPTTLILMTYLLPPAVEAFFHVPQQPTSNNKYIPPNEGSNQNIIRFAVVFDDEEQDSLKEIKSAFWRYHQIDSLSLPIGLVAIPSKLDSRITQKEDTLVFSSEPIIV